MRFRFISKFGLALLLVSVVSLPAFAIPGRLTSSNPRSRINVRSGPSLQSTALHYGLSGDRVEVLGNAQDSTGATWYFVKFNQSGAEGWVHELYIQNTSQADSAPTQRSTLPSTSRQSNDDEYWREICRSAGGGNLSDTLIATHGIDCAQYGGRTQSVEEACRATAQLDYLTACANGNCAWCDVIVAGPNGQAFCSGAGSTNQEAMYRAVQGALNACPGCVLQSDKCR